MTPPPVPASRHVCLAIPDKEVSLIPDDADDLPDELELYS